jgi:hypothetical protein
MKKDPYCRMPRRLTLAATDVFRDLPVALLVGRHHA